jgi:hypothetical protein
MASVRENSRAPLFERESALRILGNALDLATKGHGSVVSVVGEAGLGKTALVNAFRRRQRGASVLRGLCDALSTPRPLGPIRDIARDVGGALEQSFAAGRDAVFEALLAVISADKVTIRLVEDAHWADEATLDLIRFLGRRLRERRCLLIITTRRQDSATRRSLTHILGALPTGAVQSINLELLSPGAVEAWAASLDRSAESLHAMTGGNPFFVSELLQSKGARLPGSVRDAVLAGAADLTAPAREVLDQCAVVPGEIDAWLVETLWPAPASGVTECLDNGILVSSGAQLGFRHELARRVLLEALAPGHARRCHARPQDALNSSPATASMQPARPPRSVLTGKPHRTGRASSSTARCCRMRNGRSSARPTLMSSTSPGKSRRRRACANVRWNCGWACRTGCARETTCAGCRVSPGRWATDLGRRI